MLIRSICAGFALSIALAAPAGAATFTAGPNGLLFTSAAAIDNDIVVFGNSEADAPSLLINTFDDPVPYSAAAPLPGSCSDADQNPGASPAHFVNCTGTPVVVFNLGDGVDTATVTGTTRNLTIFGGSQNDELTAGNGRQTLSGDDGKDSIDGGDGADVIDGGSDNDELAGGDGADHISGNAGNDDIFGEAGDDVLEGGGGFDHLAGGAGADTGSGGSGNDALDGSEGADTLRGDAGSDSFSEKNDGEADTFDGGGDIDQIGHQVDVPYTLDLAVGVTHSTGPADQIVAIEDIALCCSSNATLLGTSTANVIWGGGGAEVIDPRAGNDLVSARGGDDAIDLRDGFADRVSCGNGSDTVQADTLDDVSPDCETVTRTDSGNAGDDRAPTVAITGPTPAAVLSTVTPNTITATATDDRGIARVIFSTGQRTLCTDESAPYTCDYRPTSADVGRDTLVAIAVDTAGQTASAVRVVNVPRFKPTSLSAATTPKRDRKAPFTFTTKGKLALPAGVAPAAGCRGTVSVSFKAGRKTVSSRRVALKSDCGYSSRVTFRLPRRLSPKQLKVVVVHGGNEVVEGLAARRHSVRTR